ncbi:ADP-dependent glucokinase/phosphofructokinase [Lachnoclostridium sp. Marseille-P6806]|uniref:ADP-dependent glucokinase/phosphofructokinase n=1 Tax=Lachnoclostridium sp. Marseille-P6806 TaxID=2364793 RepID=UPI001F5F70E8|nr:ADP-dependent glucokinase/phosphofructokinase [Lachnoclostridium sp. Marseille-P6806]
MMTKEFINKYAHALDSMVERIEKRNAGEILTAMGYTSNLDLLCDFDVDRLNALLEEHMKGEDLFSLKAASLIRNMDDLLRTIVHFCINGIGGEVDVENTEAVRGTFHFNYGMGGTAVQAALALAQIGGCSLVHLTDDSKEVCELLDKPEVFVALDDNTIGHTSEVQRRNEQEIHFIIQFQKGSEIRLGDKSARIPVSNRLILTKVTVNETVPLWDPYFNWIEKNAAKVSSNVLSSFNCLLDSNVLLERLKYVEAHVNRYKANNPEGIVYYEDAHYHDAGVRKMLLETIYPAVDIVGMNEEELKYTLRQMYHVEVDTEDVLSCIAGAEYLIKKFGIKKGIVIHTKNYGMYVGEKLAADIESGIMYGNITATSKAANGWYGTKEQIREVLQYDMSLKGIEFWETVSKAHFNEEVIVVPSRYIDKPKYTIGLGDSFVGGLQMCF